mgnify:CR=1 FL=1|tara:strand:- start:2649 stop:3314 length:666 start_codon:yes stop_codon:yes gene_type:complete
MPRKPRITIPGLPHHVTHRGTRRQRIFFGENDFHLYKTLLSETCNKYDVNIWAYCLMPNHVHLIAIPSNESGLSKVIGITHKRYADLINKRMDWRGHLWEDRHRSVPMDEPHLYAAARYVELNPVRARLTDTPMQYQWSSARAHMNARSDGLVSVEPLLDRYGDWRRYLNLGLDESLVERIRQHDKLGLPLGDENFIAFLETKIGRCLRPVKPGPKSISTK